MRKYISKQDLIHMLSELTVDQDPQLLALYREVVLYRTTKNSKKYPQVCSHLMVPRIIGLHLLNIVMLGCVTAWLIGRSQALEDTSGLIGISWALFLWMVFEASEFRSWMKRYADAKCAIVIDELLARRIIVLSKKNKTPSKHAKAAE